MADAPLLFKHRINSLDGLASIPAGQGVELDFRVGGDAIVVAHDPFQSGVTMDEYLARLGDRPAILNVKCEGILDAVLESCKRHKVENFFFLGLGLSDTVKLIQAGETRVANYFSEYHHPEEPFAWAGKVDWLWMDCFGDYPSDADGWARLSEKFKLCVGSPELYGHPEARRDELTAIAQSRTFHAVCSKRESPWLNGSRPAQ